MLGLKLFRLAVALVLSLAATAHAGAGAANPMVYTYPPPESGEDQRFVYYWNLLKSALEVTVPKWGPYVLAPSDVVMNADRSQVLLVDSKTITLLVRTTSIERESLMRPVLVPLDKGLTGYRLFLIQKPTQSRLQRVRSLNDLKAFSIGQGHTWVDTQILRHSGLTVEAGASYGSLFKMLQGQRFDLFSRGVNEISNELRAGMASNPDLAIEKNLMLYYPLPRYFFFARSAEGEQLALRTEEGLRMLMANGQFDRLYKVYKRQVLADLKLEGRRVFRIPNPTLPPSTPLRRADYWDTLAEELRVKAPR